MYSNPSNLIRSIYLYMYICVHASELAHMYTCIIKRKCWLYRNGCTKLNLLEQWVVVPQGALAAEGSNQVRSGALRMFLILVIHMNAKIEKKQILFGTLPTCSCRVFECP